MKENFSRQLINRQESERKRIAHELHDSISQSLLSIKSRASMAVERPDEQQWMLEQLNVILTSSSGAIQEIKQITHNLRPYLLDRVGLTKALQSLMRSFTESSAIKLVGAVDEIDGKLPQENEIHLYRIVQEALNNVQKHSGATEVNAAVEFEGGKIVVTIKDNGRGFDQLQRPEGNALGGLGLGGIAERVQILNGHFVLDSKPGHGTGIIITIPLKDHHV
jgi:signal transduction histidine kinase